MSLPQAHPNGNGTKPVPTREELLAKRQARADAEAPYYQWERRGPGWLCRSLSGAYGVSDGPAADCTCEDRQTTGRERGVPCKHMLALAAHVLANGTDGPPREATERVEARVRQLLGEQRAPVTSHQSPATPRNPYTRARVIERRVHQYGECHREHVGWARLLPNGWVEFQPEAMFETHPGRDDSQERADVRGVVFPPHSISRVEWLDEIEECPFDGEWERDHE